MSNTKAPQSSRLVKLESPQQIRECLAEINSEALCLDDMADALIGIVWRFGLEPIALYSRPKCIEILESQGMSNEDAEEFFEFNVIGAWAGEGTPAFCDIELSDPSKA